MLITAITGSILPMQAAINAKLGKVSGGPVIAAFISFLVGTAFLAVGTASSGMEFNRRHYGCLREG